MFHQLHVQSEFISRIFILGFSFVAGNLNSKDFAVLSFCIVNLKVTILPETAKEEIILFLTSSVLAKQDVLCGI
jgi:hypothetical protein